MSELSVYARYTVTVYIFPIKDIVY